MVVMEFCGESLETYLNGRPDLEVSALKQVRRNMREALDVLHDADLVFGDLRSPNVLVVSEADGKRSGRLVDFDWCGKVGEARYPAGLNQSEHMKWPEGAEKRSLIEKEHDDAMFGMLFEQT